MPVAGPAPVPPVAYAPGMPPAPPMMGQTPPPPGRPAYGVPPVPQPMPPQQPQPPAPQAMPQPPAPQAAAATMPASPLSGYAALPAIRMATAGDLLNNGTSIGLMVTDEQLTLITPNGPIRTESIPGIRNAIVGDYDGDGTHELALFTDTQMWILRFGEFGSIPGGRIALKELPENLSRAPYTSDGRTVLMSATAERITFYVVHPARGLVEIAATPAPAIEH